MSTDTERLETLETLAAYQEDAIEDLKATITDLWKDIAELRRDMAKLGAEVSEIGAHPALSPGDEAPPPHY